MEFETDLISKNEPKKEPEPEPQPEPVPEPIQPEIKVEPDSVQNTEIVHPPKLPHKRRIPLKLRLLLFVVLLILFGTLLVRIGNKYEEVKTADIDFKKNVQPVEVTNGTAGEWVNYRNDSYKFTLDYPEGAVVEEPDDLSSDSKVFKVTYFGDRQLSDVTTDDTLVDGYIFRVVVTENVTVPDLKAMADRKLLSYKQICPPIHAASKVEESVVDTITAQRFIVTNCFVDYQEYFAYYNGSVYELVTAYKGDIGYKQQYQQTISKILDSFRFLDKPIVKVEDPLVVLYRTSGFGITFEHPHLDEACCNIPAPVSGGYSKVVILGDKGSYEATGGKSFNGFGIFGTTLEKEKTFADHLEEQKRTLRDDYKVIKGYVSPKLTEENVTVGGVEGVWLKGYAWWGDMIYLHLASRNQVVVISKVEVTPGSFDGEFMEILRSFTFNTK